MDVNVKLLTSSASLDDARMLLDLASREAAFEGELAAAATKDGQ